MARVRVGVTFNVSIYHRSNCRRSKMSYIRFRLLRTMIAHRFSLKLSIEFSRESYR